MSEQKPRAPEREFDGPIWKHPYFLYIWLSMIPFILLLVAGWLAMKYRWLPNASSDAGQLPIREAAVMIRNRTGKTVQPSCFQLN